MGDEDRSRELPHRVRSAARAGPDPAARPMLSEEMRERIRAAVKAEREPVTDEPIASVQLAPPKAPTGPRHSGGAPGHREPAASPRTGQHAPEQESARVKPTRWRRVAVGLIAMALAVIAMGSLAITVTRYVTRTLTAYRISSALQREEAAVRGRAAAWVVQQVSGNADVSCDQVMCAALAADGFPSRQLLVLGQASPPPVTSDVVVVTAAVSDLFGSYLSSHWAPAVLAVFGSGEAEITIRAIAPYGAAAYYEKLSADLAERKQTAADLQGKGVTVSAMAQKQLTAGLPDSRLLMTIAALAPNLPIDIVQFGNSGPGASADIPLRLAYLAENDPAAHMARSAYLRSLLADLGTLPPAADRPASTGTVILPGGQAVLRIEVTAPSPLGLLGPQASG